MKNNIFIFVCFLLFMPVALSVNMTKSGALLSDYRSDDGIFNPLLTSVQVSLTSLTNGMYQPLVDDLNNDGIVDIVILDNTNIKIYKYVGALQLEASLSTGCINSNLTNMVINDIDNDKLKEIILGCKTDQVIQIFQYNTSLTLQKSHDISAKNTNYVPVANGMKKAGDVMLGCNGQNCVFLFNGCSLSWSNGVGNCIGTTNKYDKVMGAFAFNSTSLGSTINLTNDNGVDAKYERFFPFDKGYAYGDVDVDGTNEYIFSWVKTMDTSSTAEKIYIDKISISNALVITNEAVFSDTLYDFKTSGSSYAGSDNPNVNFRYYITSPTIKNVISGSNPSDMEVLYAIKLSASTARMYALSPALVNVGSYPSVFTIDGDYLTNVFTGNFLPDSTGSNQDFCVGGYTISDHALNYVCASEYRIGFGEPASDEYWYVPTKAPDLRLRHYDLLHYGTEQYYSLVTRDNFGTQIKDLSEISMYAGIITPTWASNGNVPENMTAVYSNPVSNGSLIMSDVQKNGKSDMLILKHDSLYYYNDAFVNSPGKIIPPITVNPCHTQMMKINTSVQLSYYLSDIDGDNVCSRVELYSGTTYNQLENYTCYANGTLVFSNFFKANHTISNGKIKIYAYDIVNPTKIYNYNITFSVGASGVSLGESICTINPTSSTSTGGNCVGSSCIRNSTYNNNQEPETDNLLTGGMAGLNASLKIGLLSIWLLFMAGCEIAIIYAVSKSGYANPEIIVIFGSLLVQPILLIVGTKFGFIPVGVLIILIVVMLFSIGIYLKKKFTPSAGG